MKKKMKKKTKKKKTKKETKSPKKYGTENDCDMLGSNRKHYCC